MKAFFKPALVFFAVAIILSSCGTKNETGKMIPSSAMFAVQINTKSLNDKLSWNDIKQTSWYKKGYSDTSISDWKRKILDNPEASGIDLNKDLIFFVNKGTGSNIHFVVEGMLKSAKDFEQFNKNVAPTQNIRKEGSINLLTLKDNNVVGWNDNRFIYMINTETSASGMYNLGDSGLSVPNKNLTDNSPELSSVCVGLFSLKADSSLEKNDKFSSLLKENGDIHVWQNTEEIVKSSPSMGVMGMLKLDAFLKDNISTYTVNFDKGKIDVDQKWYGSKELTDIFKKNLSGKINTDMIKSIPSQNVFAVFSAAFKPQGLKELIQLSGTDGFINMYAGQMGFTLDDLVKAGNGDVLLAFTDFKMSSDSFNIMPDNSTSGKLLKPDFNYIFSTGIADKASFQKLLDAGKKIGSQTGKDSLLNTDMNDKLFAISNSTDFTKKYLAGGNNKYDFTDKIDGHPVGLFIDFQKILTVLSAENGKPESKEMIAESMKIWNNLYMTGGDFKDGGFSAKTQINLVDANTNSLKQLNSYFDKMYQLSEAKKAGTASRPNLDSLLTPPPIDTVKVK